MDAPGPNLNLSISPSKLAEVAPLAFKRKKFGRGAKFPTKDRPRRIRAWRSRDLYLPSSKQDLPRNARKAEMERAEDHRLDREIEEHGRKVFESYEDDLLALAKIRREG